MNKHDLNEMVERRYRPETPSRPPIVFSSALCEECNKFRGRGDHRKCSEIKKARAERERLAAEARKAWASEQQLAA